LPSSDNKVALCLTKHHAMKTYVGVDVLIHVFLTLALVGGVLRFTTRPLYPRYPLDRRLGGPQNRSGRLGEEKKTAPTGNLNSDPSAVQPVASRSTDCAIPVHSDNI
jgi:hypothetical protein